MFGIKLRKSPARIDTLIGQQTVIEGDIRFSGGLHVDGTIKGNVIAEGGDALLMVSEHGRIEGEVQVPTLMLNGTVIGDVHAAERVELAAQARVTGNVYYSLIEMAMGAEVNGNLVHRGTREPAPVTRIDEAGEDGLAPRNS